MAWVGLNVIDVAIVQRGIAPSKYLKGHKEQHGAAPC